MVFIKLFILLILGVIFWEDMSKRSVHWFLFPLLALSLMLQRLTTASGTTLLLNNTLFNFFFLAIQGLLVTIYFSLKYKRWVNVTSELLGWGDVLFISSLCCYFSELSFILFYVVSILAALICWMLLKLLTTPRLDTIPLAGLQALFLALIFMGSWYMYAIDLSSNDWLIKSYLSWM